MNDQPIDDGGPALPSQPGGDPAFSGMSLRDYFAGQAINGAINKLADALLRTGDTDCDFPGSVAHCAYAIADAMLDARKEWAK